MKAAVQDLAIGVREATDRDLETIQAIYAHYVRYGTGSFEEIPPDTAEMARRRASILRRGLPFLVAEIHGQVKGYAYAGPFRTRSAYRYSVEDSVYIDPDAQGLGLGRLLLQELIARVTAKGYRQMIAVIGDSANTASIALHARMGFRRVGILESTGYKLGRWVDTVIMQRPLDQGDSTPPTR